MKATFIDSMNYRYNNPTINLTPDKEIVNAFLTQEREKYVIETFALMASMSKENGKELENIVLNNAKIKEEAKTK